MITLNSLVMDLKNLVKDKAAQDEMGAKSKEIQDACDNLISEFNGKKDVISTLKIIRRAAKGTSKQCRKGKLSYEDAGDNVLAMQTGIQTIIERLNKHTQDAEQGIQQIGA